MLILGLKDGHDGALAAIQDGELLFNLEPEKDSYSRYSRITAEVLVAALERLPEPPDVIALGGWTKDINDEQPIGAGYFGVDGPIHTVVSKVFGRQTQIVRSTHERSHIMCAHGMSPYAAEPVNCLVWEGSIGSFYHVDPKGTVARTATVTSDPGNRYAFLFGIADSSFPDDRSEVRFADAGKQMALAAFAAPGDVSVDIRRIVEDVLDRRGVGKTVRKAFYKTSPLYNVGVESDVFKAAARYITDEIFERFLQVAQRVTDARLPLIIAGGCGLNCEWNTLWEGRFSRVFVPPCTNDSGSALGTAIDAQSQLMGTSMLNWDVYAGQEFVFDAEPGQLAQFTEVSVVDSLAPVAVALARGAVLGWVNGRYEIGPRALGNRSILAGPFDPRMTERLNSIKQRAGYRPIAPVCLESEWSRWFDGRPNPYMLYFRKVRAPSLLQAVTHVDGSARPQSVTDSANPRLATLLREFGAITGAAVLCNTSLNFSGCGFINRASDLVKFVIERQLDGFVLGDRLYLARATAADDH